MTTYFMIYVLINASLVWLFRHTFDEVMAKYTEEHQYNEKQEGAHRMMVSGLAVFLFLPIIFLVAIKTMFTGGK